MILPVLFLLGPPSMLLILAFTVTDNKHNVLMQVYCMGT